MKMCPTRNQRLTAIFEGARVNNVKWILILILILAMTALAAARDKKSKAQPGPYIFTSKASTQTLKVLIVQANLRPRSATTLIF